MNRGQQIFCRPTKKIGLCGLCTSLLRSRFLGCHATLTPAGSRELCVTSQKTAAKETTYALVIGFPEGGGAGPRADVGEYGDFMGTLEHNFCHSGGGNVGTLIFECPTLGENVGTSILFN